jgi:hypothetical protein
MKIVKIARLLGYISYALLLALIAYWVFAHPKSQVLLICLLIICIIRMIASSLKSNYYEKDYNKLHEDNEFLNRRIEELTASQAKEETK